MRKTLVLLIVALLLAAVPTALAWKEGPSVNWYYVDAQYGDYHVSIPLSIEINGDPSSGQTFNVGDTITITGELHSYAAMCAGWGNEAYTDAALTVNGASGSGSDTAGDYDFDDYECAEVDTIKTLTVTYALTATGTHTAYMYSYAEAASWWAEVDVVDFAEAMLTFEVTPKKVSIDIKPGSYPNAINPNSKGVIPVAILGSSIDVTTLDLDSLKFGPSGTMWVHYAFEDVDSDGSLDLILHFRTQSTGITAGMTQASITGTLLDGTPIEGSDSIVTVPGK